MTPINCIIFPKKNPYFPNLETDRYIPHPSLTLIINKKFFYFTDNRLSLSGNSPGIKRTDIARTEKFRQAWDPL